jgi:hypothetical protein
LKIQRKIWIWWGFQLHSTCGINSWGGATDLDVRPMNNWMRESSLTVTQWVFRRWIADRPELRLLSSLNCSNRWNSKKIR